MTVVQDGFNACVEIFISDGLITGFDRDADIITLGFDNILRFLMMESLRFL